MQRSPTVPCLAAALSLALLASGARAQDMTPPTFLQPFPQLLRNQVRWVPQSARVKVFTDEPTQVLLEFDDGTSPPRRELADAELTTDHTRVPVVGLKHGRATIVRVIARDAAGNESVWPTDLVFPARSLPASFPPLTVTYLDKPMMEPGYTLFVAHGGQPDVKNWMIVLDGDGDVVWYFHKPDFGGMNVEFMRNGHLLWSSRRHSLELDILGKVLTKWYPGAYDGGAHMDPGAVFVDTDTFHHEMLELPEPEEADFLTLSTELRTYDDYPIDEIDPTITADGEIVVGDVILEFKRDGTIVRETKLLDILDPRRLCYESLGNFWGTPGNIYSTVTPGIQTHDWSHANSVVIDWSDNTYVVSCRNQDAVVKIARDTGQIVWIHGPHERWNAPWDQYLLTPIGPPFGWQYHQHAPEFNRFGNIVLFDNGNFRAIPPDPYLPLEQSYSRAVEFHVDPVAMTTEQIWWYGSHVQGAEDHMFSRFIGDADPLPTTDDILVTNGATFEPGVPVNHAQLLELTRTRPPLRVFEARIIAPGDTTSWTVYRSERIPSLYPGSP
jgi:arylsulfate sulfotransferase